MTMVSSTGLCLFVVFLYMEIGAYNVHIQDFRHVVHYRTIHA